MKENISEIWIKSAVRDFKRREEIYKRLNKKIRKYIKKN